MKTSRGETDLTTEFSETCQQIRDRAAGGYLEDAISQLKEIIRSANTPVRTECDMLSWRLAEVEKGFLGNVITPDQAGVDRNKIASQFFELVSKLQELPTHQSFDRALSPKEEKARREYLDAVKRDVANRLKVSIHQARLIDLGIEDNPSAVHLPWIFRDTSTSEEFENVEDAFDGYRRRLLILGSPGSGKTISLLHLAQKLISEAENSRSAPLPLLVNLSKLDAGPPVKAASWPFRGHHEGVQRKGKRIELWLTRELSAFPYVTADMAATWVAEGRVAAFFDGLDEVDDGYRAQLVTLLNDTYLRDHLDSVVVVCSRINEYKPLQDDKATTLQVTGSVTLQPLTREQISDYLKKAGAEGLGTALRNDDTLYQIARTPLMLSMLTFAYSGSALPGIPSSGSFTERRHHLMHECVDRMLQRKARRDKGIQFDNNRQNDVPVKEYPFAPERLEHWLGWLAVRLSVRSQTAFSPRLLYSFLQRYSDRDRRSGVWWAIAFAHAPLVLIAALIGGLFSAPLELKAWCEVILLGLAGASAYLGVAGAAYAIDNDSPQTGWKGWCRQIVQMTLIVVFVTIVAVTAVGVPSVTLSLVLPGDIPSIPAGILAILIVVLLTITAAAVSNPFSYKSSLFIAGNAVLLPLALVLHYDSEIALDWYYALAIPAGFQTVFLGWYMRKQGGGWWAILPIFSIPAGAITALWLGTHVFGVRSWQHPLLALILATVSVILIADEPFLLLGCLIATYVISAAAGGTAGAVIGLLVLGLIILVLFIAYGEGSMRALERVTNLLILHCEEAAELYWISPMLLRLLPLKRALPMRFKRFSRYTVDTFLLKESGLDIEFMHRLVRDYFALRDLQPLLESSDANVRLQAVRSLGFQGDAAVDALADFVRTGSLETREAAAWALGRISSPEVELHIEAALSDDAPQVRAAAVSSTHILSRASRTTLLEAVLHDPDLTVQQSIMEVVLRTEYFYSPQDSELGQKWLDNAKTRDDLQRMIIDAISSTNWSVRTDAIRVAVLLGDRRAVPALVQALTDKIGFMRASAADALGDLGDSQVVKALTGVLNDPDPSVQSSAQRALQKLGVPVQPKPPQRVSTLRRLLRTAWNQ